MRQEQKKKQEEMREELYIVGSALLLSYMLIPIYIRYREKAFVNQVHGIIVQAAMDLEKQNEEFRKELGYSVTKGMETIKKEIHHTKEFPMEGSRIILKNNDGETAGFIVKKVNRP